MLVFLNQGDTKTQRFKKSLYDLVVLGALWFNDKIYLNASNAAVGLPLLSKAPNV